jgi:hypothetical protein
MQSEESVFVSNYIFKESSSTDLLSFLKVIRQTDFIIAANNLITVQSTGQIKQLLILYCCYFKLFGSRVPKGIEVDPAASFHLTALLFGHLFFLHLHLMIQDSLKEICKLVKYDF